jgi:exonuclease VII small subunit
MGRLDEALKAFRTGERLFPWSCPLYEKAGTALASAKRANEALAEFERGIAAVPKCGPPYLEEARLLLGLARSAQARGKLQALIAAAPESDGAAEARAVLAQMAAARPK